MKGTAFLSVIPMRKEASDVSEMTNQVLYGEVFDIIERQEKWSKIRLHHDKYEGWIDNKQYTILEKRHTSTAKKLPLNRLFLKVTLNKEKLYLPMGSLVSNEISETKTNNTILKTAQLFINTPYLWGGRTFMGIDCSGFTQIVYRVNNILLKRDANQQEKQGKKIALENCNTGDLAFFNNKAGRVVHVGIIIREKGQIQIIHASGKVRIDKLDKEGIFNNETRSYSHQLCSIKRVS